jgi:hypothetical protein
MNFLDMVVDLRVPKMLEISSLTEQQLASKV